ncbi:peroxisomal membrane protein PEX16-like [Lineus longissimus]|uniref:peroxisomal membrane protein PEX16-like n=1 Tax=Lineus longissimus TaxID=88925 RepID=UPI002B4D000B
MDVKNLIFDFPQKYTHFVANNKDLIGQIESSCRAISYLLAGRYESSQVISELIYSASNLLALVNDSILSKAANLMTHVPSTQKTLLNFLAVIDYVEVFIEMASRSLGGDYVKWIIIVCIQITKAVLRFILLYKYKSGIQPIPPVPPLNRDKDLPKETPQDPDAINPLDLDVIGDRTSTFTLKRSKKTIRTLDSAPPLNHRSWQLPMYGGKRKVEGDEDEDEDSTILSQQQMIAESLHISRPLMHLISLYGFGLNSWKPWCLAGGVDLASLLLMGDTTEKLNKKERVEMRRRMLLMLLYLLRSPFYDRFSKQKIIILLRLLSDNIPLVGLVTNPVMEYLPVWQKIYHYVWAT